MIHVKINKQISRHKLWCKKLYLISKVIAHYFHLKKKNTETSKKNISLKTRQHEILFTG